MPEKIYKVSINEEVGTHEVTDSSTRFGYYIIIDKNKDELKNTLKEVGIFL